MQIEPALPAEQVANLEQAQRIVGIGEAPLPDRGGVDDQQQHAAKQPDQSDSPDHDRVEPDAAALADHATPIMGRGLNTMARRSA